MARIGTFGGIVFSVSERTIKTFDEMNWEFSAKYAVHDRHIRADILEYVGPELETLTFSMVLSAFLGVNPSTEIETLRRMVHLGNAEWLIIGGKLYGNYKWVIEKVSVDLQHFDKTGKLLAAKVNLTLKEYPKR